jgi:CRISPR-associated protein Cmr4
MFMNWATKTYTALTIDPLHVGSGGERLGRVDLPVARDPVTQTPKIPGTALSGALKFFTDWSLRDVGVKTNVCASTAGSDAKNNPHRDGNEKCPVCSVFGFTGEEPTGDVADKNAKRAISKQGTVQFTDALLVAFPVQSLAGPVWITTGERLDTVFKFKTIHIPEDEHFTLPEKSVLKNKLLNSHLNLGWVLLKEGSPSCGVAVSALESAGLQKTMAERMVIVSEWLFGNLVNDNLERRTSVVIDPETGAAKKGGLFTFEALQRGSLLAFDLVLNGYHNGWQGVEWDEMKVEKPDNPLTLIERFGFPGVKAVGMGGMTTRGFGRLDILPVAATAKGDAE